MDSLMISLAVMSVAMPPNPSGRIFEQVKAASTLTCVSVVRAAHDVLQDEVVAVDAEVEIEGLRIGGGLGQLFGDAIMKPGRRAVRLSPGVAQGGDRQRRDNR